jgi:hypothetical protein
LRAFSEIKKTDIEGLASFEGVLEEEYEDAIEGWKASLAKRSVDAVVYAGRIWFGYKRIPKAQKYANWHFKDRGAIIFDELAKYLDVEVAQEWFLELGTVREQFLTWLLPLAYYLFSGPELHGMDIVSGYGKDDERWSWREWSKNVKGEKIEIDEEYVYDKHTREGKKRGKDGEHFRLESSKVFPECEAYWPRDMKTFYQVWRANEASPTLEGSEGEFVGDWKGLIVESKNEEVNRGDEEGGRVAGRKRKVDHSSGSSGSVLGSEKKSKK